MHKIHVSVSRPPGLFFPENRKPHYEEDLPCTMECICQEGKRPAPFFLTSTPQFLHVAVTRGRPVRQQAQHHAGWVSSGWLTFAIRQCHATKIPASLGSPALPQAWGHGRNTGPPMQT